jgi:hypothetical protein
LTYVTFPPINDNWRLARWIWLMRSHCMLSTPPKSKVGSWKENRGQFCHGLCGQEKSSIDLYIVQRLIGLFLLLAAVVWTNRLFPLREIWDLFIENNFSSLSVNSIYSVPSFLVRI